MKKKKPAMPIDLNIFDIEWILSNKDGGGPAGPDAEWAWAFGYNRDGTIRDETRQLIQALEQYGNVIVGPYVISMRGRAKRLLSRNKLKPRARAKGGGRLICM